MPRSCADAHDASLVVLGAAYLVGVWLEGRELPPAAGPPAHAALLHADRGALPAGRHGVDRLPRRRLGVRASGRWARADTRAYFPLDPDDKENRFQRVMHFFRDNRPTMHALDEYLVRHHNAGGTRRRHPRGQAHRRHPRPQPAAPAARPGDAARRVTRPLAEYRESVGRTSTRPVERACGYHTRRRGRRAVKAPSDAVHERGSRE